MNKSSRFCVGKDGCLYYTSIFGNNVYKVWGLAPGGLVFGEPAFIEMLIKKNKTDYYKL